MALNADAIAWLGTHHAVITHIELGRFGVTPDQIRTLLRQGTLVSYVRGVYRLAGAPQTPQQLEALACASGPDVTVSHQSAGRNWGLRRMGGDGQIHVLIAGRAHRRLPGVVVHRSHRIDPVDVVARTGGIRVTSPPRTLFDLAATFDDERLESVIEQVLHEGLAGLPTLVAIGRRLRQRGRPGSARYGRVLQSRPAWLKPVGSGLELDVERAILAAGLPRPLRQHPIRLPTGEVIHPDFYWPLEAHVLEIDHVTWHGGKMDLTEDKRRDRLLTQLGIHSTRVTDDDVRRRLPALIGHLRIVLTPSGARSAS